MGLLIAFADNAGDTDLIANVEVDVVKFFFKGDEEAFGGEGVFVWGEVLNVETAEIGEDAGDNARGGDGEGGIGGTVVFTLDGPDGGFGLFEDVDGDVGATEEIGCFDFVATDIDEVLSVGGSEGEGEREGSTVAGHAGDEPFEIVSVDLGLVGIGDGEGVVDGQAHGDVFDWGEGVVIDCETHFGSAIGLEGFGWVGFDEEGFGENFFEVGIETRVEIEVAAVDFENAGEFVVATGFEKFDVDAGVFVEIGGEEVAEFVDEVNFIGIGKFFNTGDTALDLDELPEIVGAILGGFEDFEDGGLGEVVLIDGGDNFDLAGVGGDEFEGFVIDGDDALHADGHADGEGELIGGAGEIDLDATGFVLKIEFGPRAGVETVGVHGDLALDGELRAD